MRNGIKIKIITICLYLTATIVLTQDDLKIKVINLNIASQKFTPQNIQNLYNEAVKSDKNDPGIVIIALQEVIFYKTTKVLTTRLTRAILRENQSENFIQGFKLIKSGGLLTTQFYIFQNLNLPNSITVKCLPHVDKYYKKIPLKNIIAQKGAVSAVIHINNFSLQIITTHQPARFKGLLNRISTYESMYSELSMNESHHMQIVVGDLNSRTDFEHHELLTTDKLESFAKKYKNDDRVAKKDRERKNMTKFQEKITTLASNLNSKSEQPLRINFETLKKREFIEYILDHDQLRICMQRDIMFGPFKEGTMDAAPSYRLGDGYTDASKLLHFNKSDKVVGKLSGKDKTKYDPTQRKYYMEQQTISYADRVLYKVLSDVEPYITIGALETFIFNEIKTDHAALTTEFTISKDVLVGDEENKLTRLGGKKFILNLKEKVHKLKSYDSEETENKGEIFDKVKVGTKPNPRSLKIVDVVLRNGNEVETISLISEGQSNNWASIPFEITNRSNDNALILKFVINVEIDGKSHVVVINMWTSDSNIPGDSNGSIDKIVSRGIGISGTGHWIFDAELEIVREKHSK